MLEQWDLWYPHSGVSGLSFARCRVDARDTTGPVLVHAAPPDLAVTVRDEEGVVLAEGRRLKRRAPGPISVLTRTGGTVDLDDRWPDDTDLGRLVILPGGEAGILVAWWHADDRSEWRWRIELYNHR